MVHLSVADQGEGIAPEHVARVTERFYRVDTSRSRALGGTGLGLSIVKHIVERHRGRLRIDSKLGRERRSSACRCRRRFHKVSSRRLEAQGVTKPRLLLVEDDRALADLLIWHFEREGYDIERTADGEEALLLAQERTPDLVILDWMIEGVTGIEVCRRLRRAPRPRTSRSSC